MIFDVWYLRGDLVLSSVASYIYIFPAFVIYTTSASASGLLSAQWLEKSGVWEFLGFPALILFYLLRNIFASLLYVGLSLSGLLFRARHAVQTVLFGATVVRSVLRDRVKLTHLRLYINTTTYFILLVYNHRLYSTSHIWEDLYYFTSLISYFY